VVGPRPHAVAHNEQQRKLISGYMIRQGVRPGITGLAQVNGPCGETETVEKMRARVKYDLEYLSPLVALADVKIVLKTLCVLVRDRSAVLRQNAHRLWPYLPVRRSRLLALANHSRVTVSDTLAGRRSPRWGRATLFKLPVL
jgi:hypothetical protein